MHAHSTTHTFYALFTTVILVTGCVTPSNTHCPKGTTSPCPTSADVWDARAHGTVNATTTSAPITYSVAHAKQTLRYNLTQPVPTSQYTMNTAAHLSNTTLTINASTTKQRLRGTTAIRLTNPQATEATTATTINGDRPRRIAIYTNDTWLNTTLAWENTTPTETTKNT